MKRLARALLKPLASLLAGFRGKGSEVVVVSGLPRSGTSAMMNMLAQGGFEVVTDGKRQPDASNPEGYFEAEAVKRLAEDSGWLRECRGRAVKVVSPLLQYLPADLHYRAVFMLRPVMEVTASQERMLQRSGCDESTDQALAGRLQAHLKEVRRWLVTRSNFDVLFVDYRGLVENPRGQAARVAHFLRGDLDVEKMAASIRLDLYRERADREVIR